MISVVFTDNKSSLVRHEVNVKVDGKLIDRCRFSNQFWLVDFTESFERTASEASALYLLWLAEQISDNPQGPVATQFKTLVHAYLNHSEIEIIVAPNSEHGTVLRNFIVNHAAEKGWAKPVESSLLYSQSMPKVEYAKRDNLSCEPDDETIWTTEYLKHERIVRIIGNKHVMLGVMISESEALVPGHDLVTLKKDKWFYDGPAASEEEKAKLQAALTLFFHEEWSNEREVGRPETRFEEKHEAFFLDAGLALDDEDLLMLELDKDQQAAERTIISWYHQRDLHNTSNYYSLGLKNPTI